MSQKVVAQGGNGGSVWNDGVSKGVKKVLVGGDDYTLTFVKFEYVKDTTMESHEHGPNNQKPKEFVVNYPKEYIISVEGTYAKPTSYTTITSLVFKTSRGRTSQTFGNQKFVLENNGQKLVGFHGRSGHKKSLCWKRQGLCNENHGRLCQVWRAETHAHGLKNEELQEFLLDPDEYITSVEGTYGKVGRFGSPVITSLAFTTSKGRTSLTFGATKFVLEDNGRQLVGFPGRSGAALDAIGAHFAVTETT